uniref:Transmembrane protein n=1 Tax=Strongyloides venezuelensis TaxID=75913 RepID=A0A0K0FXA6_STRVS
MLIFRLILIFIIFYQVQSSCSYFNNYYLLGELNSTSNTIKKCKNQSDKCIYIAINIPALVIGNFSGCQDGVSETLSKIIHKRQDILDLFKPFIKNDNNNVYVDAICKSSNNINQTERAQTMSGMMRLYSICYSQGQENTESMIYFDPPLNSTSPVQCLDTFDKPLECKEGYCGIFQIAYLEGNGSTQKEREYASCPNDLINQLYLLKNDQVIKNIPSLSESLSNMGDICANNFFLNTLNADNSSAHFCYIGCFIPNDNKYQSFLEFPNLKLISETMTNIGTTSIDIYSTTPKSTSKKMIKMWLLLFLTLCLIFNVKI